MNFDEFLKSQMYCRKSMNLIRTGFNFESDPEQEYYRIQRILNDLYHVRLESTLGIQKIYGYPSSRTSFDILKLFDVEIRNLSTSQFVAIEQGRSNPHEQCHKYIQHTSWDGNVCHLRSSYEQAFAKILDESRTPYQVENLRIQYYHASQGRWRIAIPDFFLPETCEIIEVKAEYYLDRDQMADKFKAYRNLSFKPRLWVDFNFDETL